VATRVAGCAAWASGGTTAGPNDVVSSAATNQ
jgi:hypothetical protein